MKVVQNKIMMVTFLKELYAKSNGITSAFPDKELANEFIEQLFHFLFLRQRGPNETFADLEKEFDSLKSYLSTLVYDVMKNGEQSQRITEQFYERIPAVYAALLKDAASIVKNDPAAKSADEVIVAYPGFYAIAVYRISHELYVLGVNMLPRLLTEYAHSKTGIDIHPGASIGEGFFIDHGTGIVIGETAVIGNNVKMYQGVTIGAMLSDSQEIMPAKRHPTIEDGVVIYAGATILGGTTVIGRDSVIGGNVWLTTSVLPESRVYLRSEISGIGNERSL